MELLTQTLISWERDISDDGEAAMIDPHQWHRASLMALLTELNDRLFTTIKDALKIKI